MSNINLNIVGTGNFAQIEAAIKHLESVDIDKEIQDHELLKDWLEKNEAIRSLNKERASLDSALIQAQKAVEKSQKDIQRTEDHNCHACGQKLHDDKRNEMLVKLRSDLNEALGYQQEITDKLSEVMALLSKVGEISKKPDTFYEKIEDAYNHKNNLENLKKQLDTKTTEIDPYQEQIEELENTALQEIDWNTVNSLTSLKEHQDFLLKLLTNKDSFIRKKIIDQNLAYLNQRLTYYLDKTGLPHQVVFQNDLQVEITQLGQDLDFDNLSRGERNRLILSLSWAFRDMWENLYQPINLLFIDELIDNGLDAAGVENSLAILKKMARESRKNIYLISHKDELIGRVNNVLKVIKENGFTSYSNDIDVVE